MTEYHEWYYNTEVWKTTTFLGIPIQKSVMDLWNYQEILAEIKPSLVVEFGAFRGGSALYFAEMLQLIRQGTRVLSVDVSVSLIHPLVSRNPRITFLRSSSTHPLVAARIKSMRDTDPGAAFFIIDSDHSKEHVLNELISIRDVTRPGDYVIVEDGNVNGHPVLPDFGAGPFEAIEEYDSRFPDDYAHDTARESKFGWTFAPRGFLIRR